MKSPRVNVWSEKRGRAEFQGTGRGRKVYKGTREVVATRAGDAKDREAEAEESGQQKPDPRKMKHVRTRKSIL